MCKVFNGRLADFSQVVFFQIYSKCLTRFELLAKLTNSSITNIKLVIDDYNNIKLKDVVEGPKFKVLCIKPFKTTSSDSKTSISETQSSISGTDSLIIAICIASLILLAVSLTY